MLLYVTALLAHMQYCYNVSFLRHEPLKTIGIQSNEIKKLLTEITV